MIERRWSPFPCFQPDTSSHCETTDMRAVCLFAHQLVLVALTHVGMRRLSWLGSPSASSWVKKLVEQKMQLWMLRIYILLLFWRKWWFSAQKFTFLDKHISTNRFFDNFSTAENLGGNCPLAFCDDDTTGQRTQFIRHKSCSRSRMSYRLSDRKL